MTRIDHDQRRSFLRRGLGGAAVLMAVSLLVAPGGADASVRTTSETIAVEADRALDAFVRWQSDRNPADYVRFVQSRENTATMTATDLQIDPAALDAAWAAAPVDKQLAVLAAMSQLGVPYRSISSEPGVGFDCSGLTTWAFAQAGLEIPRTSRDQFRAAERIDREEAEPGDFVYYPGHISIYLGEGMMVHSPNSGNHVEAVTIPTKRSVDFADPFATD
jgi:cell wall-associated NlpC family hydrolase